MHTAHIILMQETIEQRNYVLAIICVYHSNPKMVLSRIVCIQRKPTNYIHIYFIRICALHTKWFVCHIFCPILLINELLIMPAIWWVSIASDMVTLCVELPVRHIPRLPLPFRNIMFIYIHFDCAQTLITDGNIELARNGVPPCYYILPKHSTLRLTQQFTRVAYIVWMMANTFHTSYIYV